MNPVRSAQGFIVAAGNGTTLWEGTGALGSVIELVENASITTAIGRGEAVTLATGGSAAEGQFSRLGNDWSAIGDGTTTTASLPQHARIRGNRVAAAADVCFLGVSLNTIPARDTTDLVTTKYAGPIASVGSLMLVVCVSSLTSSALGNAVIGSATAGSVNANTTFTIGTKLGTLVKANGTTIASGQTGSATLCGVFVNPA